VGREASEEELRELGAWLADRRSFYGNHLEEARAMLRVGSGATEAGNAVEMAAWACVGRAILNLHEVITRP
jgi:hypothetical protein